MSTLPDFIDLAYLQEVWKPLTTDEQVRADAIIGQVSSFLRLIGKNNHIDIDEKIADDTSGVYGDSVKMVVANAVQRAMAKPVDLAPDATSWSQSASPYSESMSFSGSSNQDAYFKKKELQLLGLGSLSGRGGISLVRGIRGGNSWDE